MGTPHFESATKGPRSFIDGDGNVFLSKAIKVIDVSRWQGDIDWSEVASTDVDAAILRIGYGMGNMDSKFDRNCKACISVGMPFGVYLYSYAYDADCARREGQFVASVLSQYGLDEDIPVFYDLEEWQWSGHTPPKSASVYAEIFDSFREAVEASGYTSVYVYSYYSYFQSRLDTASIRNRAAWVARYGQRCGYDFSTPENERAWQYTDAGTCDGIDGSAVDISAFSLFPYFADRICLYGFNDVFLSTPHQGDIGWLKQAGIASGYSDGSFGCMVPVYRQDMAAFLFRMAARDGAVGSSWQPTADQKRAFSDVSESTPHCREIWWLASTGISAGYVDGSFGGMTPVFRQDMAAFLYRLAGSPKFDVDAGDWVFTDVDASTPHCKEILWLAQTGISEGYPDGTFRGMTPVYRQDMAAFLHRFANSFKVGS
jgi:lysozyme